MVSAINLEETDRVMFKIGTSAIEWPTARGELGLNPFLANSLAAGIAQDFYDVERGFVIYPYLVSSGAVYMGMVRTGIKERPTEPRELQALASIGEQHLGHWYDEIFRNYGLGVNQGLLTEQTLQLHYETTILQEVLQHVFSYGIVPRFNENDFVSDEEFKRLHAQRSGDCFYFSDNDWLANVVAKKLGIDVLFFITDVDGMYDKDPKEHPDARLIDVLTEETQLDLSGDNGEFGRGGPGSKYGAQIDAAKNGITCLTVNAKYFYDKDSIGRILKGEVPRTIVPAHFDMSEIFH